MLPACPEVDIVVVSYNQRKLLARCLTSLLGLDYPAGQLHIVVVDNASLDGSAEMIRHGFPAVEIIALPRNVGFAAANNLAIRQTNSPFVALVNNDVWVDSEWLRELVAASAPGVGSCTSKIMLDCPGDLIQNAGVRLLRNGSCADRGSLGARRGYEHDQGQYDCAQEVFSFCGAAALLNRRMLDDVGLFDERHFMYYEDVDLAWRARRRGWRHRYVPTALAYHRHAASSGQGSPFFVRHVVRSRLLTLLENASAKLVLRGLASVWAENLLHWSSCLRAFVRADRIAARSEIARAYGHFSGAISVGASLRGALRDRASNSRRATVSASVVEKAWIGR